MSQLRLGVNIDHVATVRNARGGAFPDPVRAAILAEQSGADGITAHLREDRRHISDDDIARLTATIKIPLNLEMAATDEMLAIALKAKPHAVCIVPEKREERTTEGGIDVFGQFARLQPIVARLVAAGIRVSMFVEPDRKQLDASRSLGAPVVELHRHGGGDQRLGGNQLDPETRRERKRPGLLLGRTHRCRRDQLARHDLALHLVGVVAILRPGEQAEQKRQDG